MVLITAERDNSFCFPLEFSNTILVLGRVSMKVSQSGPALYRGSLVYLDEDPFLVGSEAALRYEPDGAILVEKGRIAAVGSASELARQAPSGTTTHDYSRKILVPGFVDTHSHYVQSEMIASYGRQLLEWLNEFTFVREQDFKDPAHAQRIAAFFCNELLRNGTTTAAVFCASYSTSVDALFEAARARGMRVLAGKVWMDRNAPEALLEATDSSYEGSKELIEKWHRKDRLLYTLTPRFLGTSSPAQLEAVSQLWREYPELVLQSHVSENLSEVAWVKQLFPARKNYLDVYDHYGLLGPGAIYAHGIHLSDGEITRLSETGAAISHCPTSNLFLGSGLFPLARFTSPEHPVRVGLGTDVGAGTSFSLLQTMQEAYKVAQLQSYSLDAIKAFYLATLGGARALRLDDRVGTFRAGLEADIVVLDPEATPAQALRYQRSESIEDILFSLLILGDDRSVHTTIAAGKIAHERDGGE